MDKVIIFDTTLRDGEQAAGGMLSIDEKMEIARQLEKLGVDVIEAGFPISSKGDFEAVQRISREIRGSSVCALCHAQADAIDTAWAAVKEAARPRIHVFLASSDIHLAYQLHKSREEVLERAREMVARAKGYTDDIEFSPMDASRSDPQFLYQVLEATIAAGATTVNIPDTVGYAIPGEFGNLIAGIIKNVPNISRAVISVHCHNDLGLAVANSLEAVRRGARQVECTINGIGERAGNASMEEVVMAIHTRKDIFDLITGIDTTQFYRASRLVSELTGFPVQPNKAIVGANAFRHESGIHQDGVIKAPVTFEIMDPRSVGIPASVLTLGKLSGRHAFKERLAELGYTLDDAAFARAFTAFKELADKKKEVTDRDIESLIAQDMRTSGQVYQLEQLLVSCGTLNLPTATVKLKGPAGESLVCAAMGSGPVDAAYKAIDRLVGLPSKLVEFTIKSVTGGIDALGEVLVRIESEGRTFAGRGSATDIILASAQAYLNALNRLQAAMKAAERNSNH